MNRTFSKGLLCLIITATFAVAFANSMAAPPRTLEGDVANPLKEEGLQRVGLLTAEPNGLV
jgi:hypothetical protein